MVFISGKSDNFIVGVDIKMFDSVNSCEDVLVLSEMC